MSQGTSGRTWDEASSPAAQGLARRFEAAWRRSETDPSAPRPDVRSFLAEAETTSCPGARLALLRAEMGLRWEAGERVGIDDYRRRFPTLEASSDILVALIYEEFCLREEFGEEPDPAEYLTRNPNVASQLRRVLDIHGLVGSAGSLATTTGLHPGIGGNGGTGPEFPRAGETIAGFRLVEELGRGSFARVFRAEERQLADRPVALKVARTGTREPQTLARLQHTHIVPVHSYRTDPATGLHLLCMPYFGRVTLARVLGDSRVRKARNGAELVESLDRLSVNEPPPVGRSAGRAALSRRTYAQAIAWWGARMAEALDHAHDHGVLHRDIKPSNVLVTRDGLPMLLDFNLAREIVLDGREADDSLPGGTLDYMAPEQLEELAGGGRASVDARSDVFAMGVVLYEALAGYRPFASPRDATSAGEVLDRAQSSRRDAVTPLRQVRPDVSAALDAVVARCLAYDPADRYQSAADLAFDLQAVADDRSPRIAREPFRDRATRWLRTNNRVLAAAIPSILALAVIATLLVRERVTRARALTDARALYETGLAAEKSDDFERAKLYFEAAARMAERPDTRSLPGEIKRRLLALRRGLPLTESTDLDALRLDARGRFRAAELTQAVRDAAEAVREAMDPLRFRLTGFGGDVRAATDELYEVLAPFYVFEKEPWLNRPNMALLDDKGRAALISEVNELLFLWALVLDREAGSEETDGMGRSIAAARTCLSRGLEVCDLALSFAVPRGPWEALRSRLNRRLAALAGTDTPPGSTPIEDEVVVGQESTALGWFQWGALRVRQDRRIDALACFRQAVRLDPGNYWYQYYLAYTYDSGGIDQAEALRHYEVAVALKPQSPWVRFSRARLYRARGNWGLAMEDLQRALSDFRGLKGETEGQRASFERQTHLEMGLVLQSIGDLAGARREYDRVIESDPHSRYTRAARLNRAKLDADSGAIAESQAAYDALVGDDPSDGLARLGRALLALRRDRPVDAEIDLSAILDQGAGVASVSRVQALSFRSLARLALGRPSEALRDAEEAWRIRPSPWRERLRDRALLALGRAESLSLGSPEEIDRLPWNGAALRNDLRRLAGGPDSRETADRRPGAAPSSVALSPERLRLQQNRAVALSYLGDHDEALATLDRAIALAPESARLHLVRAGLLRRAGRNELAQAEVERALALDPDDPRGWQLRARLRILEGNPAAALADLDHAMTLGAEGAELRSLRAEAHAAQGDARGAANDWTESLAHDPEDPVAYLGRAEAFTRLGQWESSLADLEHAAGWADGRIGLRLRIALGYARCLASSPLPLPRLLAVLRRTRL
ncbi:MAG: protein kinase [Isosphaeraceae bacterium]